MSDLVNEGPVQSYIDLGTLQVVMPGGKNTFTGEEWQALRWPPCPRCGATINVACIDVTSAADQEPMCTAGRWECPNGCDPRKCA